MNKCFIINDVVYLVGVLKCMVFCVINGVFNVGKVMRERIEVVIKEMGFVLDK